MATIVGSAAGGIWSAGGSWVGGVAPTAADNVQLTAASGNITTTGATAPVCRSLDCSGYTGTLAGSVALSIGDATAGAGNVALKLVAGMGFTHAATITMVSTSTTQQTIDSGGKSLFALTFNGTAGSWKLAAALTVSNTLTLTKGDVDLGNFALDLGNFSSIGSLTRSLTMGTSTVTIASAWSAAATGMTLSAASSTISVGNGTFAGGGLSYGTLSCNGAGTLTLTGANTFVTLTRTMASAGLDGVLSLSANQTVSGTFTATGNGPVSRLLVNTSTRGTPQTLSAAVTVMSNVDFSDITAAGAATWTGTSIGDCLGNTGITADAPTTQTHTASAGGNWSDVTKWTSRIPLPQDTVVVNVNTTGTLTLDMARLGADVSFAGFAGTLSWTGSPYVVYGSLTFGSALTIGTMAPGLTLSARSSKTLTCAGKTLSGPITIAAPGGTYTLADDLTISSTLTLSIGTLTTANFTLQCTTYTQTSSASAILNLGSSTVNLQSTATATVWNMGASAVINAGTSTIAINATSANQRTFAGAGKTYSTLTYTVAGSTGTLLISGSNSFDTINFSDVTNARTLLFTASTTTTILSTFNVNGTSGKVMTINSSTGGTFFTLTKAGGIVSCDYLTLRDSHATGTAGWFAGLNSTSTSGNTGWIFGHPVSEAGSSTGTSTAAATMGRSKDEAGAATGTSTAAATMGRTRGEVGAATGTSTAAATMGRTEPESGAATGTSTDSAADTRSRAEAGSATGTSTDSAADTRIRAEAGSATGTSTDSATVARARGEAGSATGTSADSAAMSRTVTEVGAATGTSTAGGTLGRTVTEAGAAAGTSTARATLSRPAGRAYLFFVNALPVRVGAVQHQILIGDWRTQKWVELSTIAGRTFTGHLTDPSTVAFTMPGDSPEAALLAEGISDVKWIRDGVPIFWGRLVGAIDTVGATSYDIACTCVDYRGLLDSREIQTDGSGTVKGAAPLQYDNTWFIEDIIWDLIQHTQTQLGGDLGITKGVFPHTGITLEDRHVADVLEFRNSDKIWACIKAVLAMDPSVEINIDATAKKLNVSYPFRGTDRGAKLDYGGLIASVHRTVDIPGQFANYTRTWYSGEGDLNKDAQILALPDLPNRPEGRWDQSFHAIDLTTKAGQAKAAAYNFGKASKVLPAMDMTFAAGAWEGPNAVWIGDPVTAIVRRGRLDVNDKTRVFALTLSLDQSNVETVTVTVGLPKINPFKTLTDDLRKLKQH